VTYPTVADTNLTLGVRYTWKNISGSSSTEVNGLSDFASLIRPAVLPTLEPASGAYSYSKPTYRAILDDRFTPDFMAYISTIEGFGQADTISRAARRRLLLSSRRS
jgi:hypothetical protein